MKILATGRRNGKTTRMMKEAKKTGAVVCCIHYLERKRIIAEFGLDPRNVVTAKDIQNGSLRGRSPDTVVYMDNLDIILSDLLGCRVDFATVTGEAIQLKRSLWKRIWRRK